jgi:hypothetical protein
VEMFPQARGYSRAWYIDERDNEFAESVVGKLAGLWEAIHAFAHLSVDVAIGNLGFQLVKFNDGWRQHMCGDADVFIIRKVTAVIEIFQI